MKCLRCGYCCTQLSVIVVKNPEYGIKEGNLIPVGMKGPERCPHLMGVKPGEYSCSIHDREWFKDTPCATHQSHYFHNEHEECPMGRHILNINSRKSQWTSRILCSRE